MAIKIVIRNWKIIFWLTLGLLLVFSVTPRGYAQALPETGTSSESIGTSSEPAVVQPAAETIGTSTESAAPAPTQPVVEPPPPPLPPSPEPPAPPAQYPYKKIRNFQLLFPSPNQPHYFKGTYEKEVRLNGRGTNGADGTQVYTGMIAAPKTFPFGTKMQIPV